MRVIELVEIYRDLTRARSVIEQELMDRLDWKDLYTLGLTISAIRKYREKSDPPITLIQAKEAIEKHFRK